MSTVLVVAEAHAACGSDHVPIVSPDFHRAYLSLVFQGFMATTYALVPMSGETVVDISGGSRGRVWGWLGEMRGKRMSKEWWTWRRVSYSPIPPITERLVMLGNMW